MRILVAFAVIAALAAPAHAKPVLRQSFEQTCRHYDNRARFKPRTGQVEFVVILAESCARALGEYQAGGEPPALRAASESYLRRLTELRELIVAMNTRRAYASGAMEYRSVSGAGEYLIAREMGVLSAFDAWIDSGADFELAGR